jgi:hypothetical protein
VTSHLSKAVACAAVFSLAAPTSLLAHTILPHNTAFSAFGEALILDSAGHHILCTMKISGDISKKGVGSISSASFVVAKTCPNPLTATGLPWKMKATTSERITVGPVGIEGNGLETCGPAQVSGAISQGDILFGAAPVGANCVLTATLVASPPLSIGD